MVWFNGTITEAITSAKIKNKLLVILITGEEETLKTTARWENEEIKALCNNNCVCLKLKAKSDSGVQFSQIYPVVLVPSTFLIGSNGQLIHVVSEDVEDQDFLSKLHDAIIKIDSSSSSNTASSSGATSEGQVELSEEEKKRRQEEYLEKISERRLQKLREEQKKIKEAEIQRRELGRQMQNFQEEQRKRIMLEQIAERKKDKELEKRARQEVLQRIKQDRLERSKKAENLESSKQPSSSKPAKIVSDKVTLQYRFTDGSSTVLDYKIDETLAGAIKNLKTTASDKLPAHFALSLGFTSTVFDETHYGQKLVDLGLSPRSSLRIVPINKKEVSSSIGWSCLSCLSLLFVFPLKILWSILLSISPFSTTERSTTAETNNYSEDNTSDESKPAHRASNSDDGLRKRSNVHRLHDSKKSDDDTANWNGNSTQQL